MAKYKLNTYLDLCTQVYDISKPEPPVDAYAFYRSYAQETKGPILEPMCGTGRFLLPLLKEGFDVHGFDASKKMLVALKAKAASQKLKPKVWWSFAEELQTSEIYGLIFIPSGSFGLITDLNRAKKALRKLCKHLAKDGTLLFEGETLSAVPKELGIWRGSVWPRPDGKFILESRLAVLDGDLCTAIGRYDLISANKIVRTQVEELKIRLYQNRDALFEIVKVAGFKTIRMIKAFDRSLSPGKTDETIIYECRKS